VIAVLFGAVGLALIAAGYLAGREHQKARTRKILGLPGARIYRVDR
jgi:hypothetical protein